MSKCISCGKPTSDALRVTRYQLNRTEAAESREIPLCVDCQRANEPFFRGWRTTYEPPFLYGRARSAARCSNPACSKRATNVLLIGAPSALRGYCHEVYACDECLEMLYAQLFGTFREGGPWTS